MKPSVVIGEYAECNSFTGIITRINGDMVTLTNVEVEISDRSFTTKEVTSDISSIKPILMDGWIGFDLDGTFAKSTPRFSLTEIPDPNPFMINLLWELFKYGYNVKIMTARAYEADDQVPIIFEWLKQHSLPLLSVTNLKDKNMIGIVDDRAIKFDRLTGVSENIRMLIDRLI